MTLQAISRNFAKVSNFAELTKNLTIALSVFMVIDSQTAFEFYVVPLT